MKIEEFNELVEKRIIKITKEIEFDEDAYEDEQFYDYDEGKRTRVIFRDGYIAENADTGVKYLVYGLSAVLMTAKTEKRSELYHDIGRIWNNYVIGYEPYEWKYITEELGYEVVEITSKKYETIKKREYYKKEDTE